MHRNVNAEVASLREFREAEARVARIICGMAPAFEAEHLAEAFPPE